MPDKQSQFNFLFIYVYIYLICIFLLSTMEISIASSLYDCIILLCNIPQSGGRMETGESASQTFSYTILICSRHTISALLKSASALLKSAWSCTLGEIPLFFLRASYSRASTGWCTRADFTLPLVCYCSINLTKASEYKRLLSFTKFDCLVFSFKVIRARYPLITKW